jgi:hypothetical protein
MEQQNLIQLDEYKEKRLRFVYSIQGNPRQATLAYFAGIIDGEGTIRIQKSKPYFKNKNKNYTYSAGISIGMVEKRIPELFHEIFGGTLYEECVPKRRSIWRWQVSGRMSVYKILEEIAPYLILKHEHAYIVMEFCKDWHTPYSRQAGLGRQELQRREEAYQVLRQLNSVGAAATTKQESIREGEMIV